MDFLLQEADIARSEIVEGRYRDGRHCIDYTQVEEVAASEGMKRIVLEGASATSCGELLH